MKKRNNIVNLKFLLGFLLLYGLVAVCYSPVFSNGFLDWWDDQWMVRGIIRQVCLVLWMCHVAFFHNSTRGDYEEKY